MRFFLLFRLSEGHNYYFILFLCFTVFFHTQPLFAYSSLFVYPLHLSSLYRIVYHIKKASRNIHSPPTTCFFFFCTTLPTLQRCLRIAGRNRPDCYGPDPDKSCIFCCWSEDKCNIGQNGSGQSHQSK